MELSDYVQQLSVKTTSDGTFALRWLLYKP
jgi:hypothetical protein